MHAVKDFPKRNVCWFANGTSLTLPLPSKTNLYFVLTSTLYHTKWMRCPSRSGSLVSGPIAKVWAKRLQPLFLGRCRIQIFFCSNLCLVRVQTRLLSQRYFQSWVNTNGSGTAAVMLGKRAVLLGYMLACRLLSSL